MNLDPLAIHTLLALPPKNGYLRLAQIIGNKKTGIPAIIPVSRTTWLDGVKSGRYPKSTRLSNRCVAWKVSDILGLLESLEKEVR